MEPSAEIVQLLREMRDAQREGIAVNKAWMKQADEQNRLWREEVRAEKERRTAAEPDVARWREANELYLKRF